MNDRRYSFQVLNDPLISLFISETGNCIDNVMNFISSRLLYKGYFLFWGGQTLAIKNALILFNINYDSAKFHNATEDVELLRLVVKRFKDLVGSNLYLELSNFSWINSRECQEVIATAIKTGKQSRSYIVERYQQWLRSLPLISINWSAAGVVYDFYKGPLNIGFDLKNPLPTLDKYAKYAYQKPWFVESYLSWRTYCSMSGHVALSDLESI